MKKLEFSKQLLVQESILIWIITIAFITLAFYCVALGFIGSLPWLTAMVSLPWTAYGVSQAFYYKKSTKENCEGIVFHKVLADIDAVSEPLELYEDAAALDEATAAFIDDNYTDYKI